MPDRISAPRPGSVVAAVPPGLDTRVPLMEAFPDLIGLVGSALTFRPCREDPGGGDPHQAGRADGLEPLSSPGLHGSKRRSRSGSGWQDRGMTVDTVPLAAAAHRTRTGDLWIFRGRTPADRLIQTLTNSPVNHVGVAVVLDDMPPLMWHAEMGRALTDVWTGRRQRGVQLHDLEEAVRQWSGPYGQRAWFRQISPEVSAEQEDALLSTIARLDGVSFPSAGRLTARWARGRLAARGRRPTSAPSGHGSPEETGDHDDDNDDLGGRIRARLTRRGRNRQGPALRVEAAYCAEVVGITLEEMGILRKAGDASWYDPGRFWSGDDLPLAPGWGYGREIAVTVSHTGQRR